MLFHYNGHGVPKPTTNGEIWVFNSEYTTNLFAQILASFGGVISPPTTENEKIDIVGLGICTSKGNALILNDDRAIFGKQFSVFPSSKDAVKDKPFRIDYWYNADNVNFPLGPKVDDNVLSGHVKEDPLKPKRSMDQIQFKKSEHETYAGYDLHKYHSFGTFVCTDIGIATIKVDFIADKKIRSAYSKINCVEKDPAYETIGLGDTSQDDFKIELIEPTLKNKKGIFPATVSVVNNVKNADPLGNSLFVEFSSSNEKILRVVNSDKTGIFRGNDEERKATYECLKNSGGFDRDAYLIVKLLYEKHRKDPLVLVQGITKNITCLGGHFTVAPEEPLRETPEQPRTHPSCTTPCFEKTKTIPYDKKHEEFVGIENKWLLITSIIDKDGRLDDDFRIDYKSSNRDIVMIHPENRKWVEVHKTPYPGYSEYVHKQTVYCNSEGTATYSAQIGGRTNSDAIDERTVTCKNTHRPSTPPAPEDPIEPISNTNYIGYFPVLPSCVVIPDGTEELPDGTVIHTCTDGKYEIHPNGKEVRFSDGITETLYIQNTDPCFASITYSHPDGTTGYLYGIADHNTGEVTLCPSYPYDAKLIFSNGEQLDLYWDNGGYYASGQ